MAEGLEQLGIWSRRIWRQRWRGLGVTWATCALGWTGVGLLAPQQPAAAGLLLGLVLLAGVAAGAATAALVAGRAPVFDSVVELQRSFRRPVLGSVADLTAGSWQRAISHMTFAVGCLALFGGLIVARALG